MKLLIFMQKMKTIVSFCLLNMLCFCANDILHLKNCELKKSAVKMARQLKLKKKNSSGRQTNKQKIKA